MSSPEANDEYREINQHESKEFVEAVENLEEFWEWGIGDDPALWEEIYGPVGEWTEETKNEFADRGHYRSSYFRIDGIGIYLDKQVRSDKELEATTEHEMRIFKTQWGVSIGAANKVGDLVVRVSSQHQIGQGSDGLYVPSFIQWERFQLPGGAFTMQGRSPAEQAAIDKMDLAQRSNDSAWGQPPSFWDAMGEFNDAVAEITRNRMEMEEITGIDTRRFTKAKFDEVMGYLGHAGSKNFVPNV